MSFDINVWRRYYNKVQKLGGYLKECADLPRLISPEERLSIENEIIELLKMCAAYLDHSSNKMPPPLWAYNNKDQTTWPSEETFAYHHCLK